MPKIPQFGNIQTQGTRYHIPSDIKTGQGLVDLGSGINSLANLMLQKKKEGDQLDYQKAMLQVQQIEEKKLFDPDSGFINLEGENALNGKSEEYRQSYTDEVDKIKESLKDNWYYKEFEVQTEANSLVFNRNLMKHESDQQSVVAEKTMRASIDLAINNAATLYNDQISLDIGYKTINQRLQQYLTEQGAPAEVRQAAELELKQNYFASAIDSQIANTGLNGGSYAALSNNLKNSPAFNQLSEPNRLKYLSHLKNLSKQQAAQNRDSMTLELKNAEAMQGRGIEAPNIPEARFKANYGDKQGSILYKNYQAGQTYASNIKDLQNEPTSNLTKYLTENISGGGRTGDTSDPLMADTESSDFATKVAYQDSRGRASATILKLRESDPVAAAYNAGEIKQLDYSTPENAVESIGGRIATMQRITNRDGSDFKIFSKNEAEHFGQMINNMTSTEQNQLLKGIRAASENDISAYNAILKQIGADNPSFAFAGGVLSINSSIQVKDGNWFNDPIFANPEQISTTIITGLEARKGFNKQKGYEVPNDSLNNPKELFSEYVGTAFAGYAQGYEETYQTALDYYSGESVKSGDYSKELDVNRWNRAMRVATGGVIEFNGADTILPYGMDETSFITAINNEFYKKAVSTGIVKGEKPKSQNDAINMGVMVEMPVNQSMPYQLERRANGQYYVINGTTYLYGADGKRLILNVNGD